MGNGKRNRGRMNSYDIAEHKLKNLVNQKKQQSINQMRQVQAFNNQLGLLEQQQRQHAITQLQYDKFLREHQTKNSNSLEDYQ